MLLPRCIHWRFNVFVVIASALQFGDVERSNDKCILNRILLMCSRMTSFASLKYLRSDANNVSVFPQVGTLNALARLKAEVIDNVVSGNKIINDCEDETFVTTAFPTLFPHGIAKHIHLYGYMPRMTHAKCPALAPSRILYKRDLEA